MNYKNIYRIISDNKVVFYTLPFFIYLIVACVLWGPNHLSDLHRDFFTPSGDPFAFVWYMRWWPFSIAHGLNPILEKYIYYPSGFNLAWSTSIPTLAAIMLPVTLIWGSITSFNVLALVALPFSALCCFYLVYYITRKYFVSVLCGFIYGFSSFQLGELLGHPNLYTSFVPPLIVLAVMLRVNEHIKKIPFIIFFAILLVLQFGITSEVFGSMYLFGALAWLLTIIFADKKLRTKLYSVTKEIIIGTIVALILLGPFIYYLIVGYSGTPKVFNSPIGYSSDLLNYLLPTRITLLGGSLFQHISNNYTGNASEQGAYLGIPLIMFLIGFSAYYWKKWYVKVLAIMVAVIGVSSLGPVLQIDGKQTFLKLPWYITSHLPVLRSMLPTRFPQYLFLLAAIMLGIWLSKNPEAVKKRTIKIISYSKYLLVLLVIVTLLPKPSNFSWQSPNIPNLFTPKLIKQYIGINKNIVIMPYSDGADPMLWQANSGMLFKTSNGYTGYTPFAFANNRVAIDLTSGQPGPNFLSQFPVFCATHHVSEILITPAAMPADIEAINEIESFNWPSQTVDNIVIIKVPKIDQ